MWGGLAIRTVPIAAPPMINSSAGWSSTARLPFSIRYPPTTAPKTTTMPMIANITVLASTSRPHSQHVLAASAVAGAPVERALGAGDERFDSIVRTHGGARDGDCYPQPLPPP